MTRRIWQLLALCALAVILPACEDHATVASSRPAPASAPAQWRASMGDPALAGQFRRDARGNAQALVDAMNAEQNDLAISYQGKLAEFTGSLLQSDASRLIIGDANGNMIIILLRADQQAPSRDNPPAAITAMGIIQLVDPRPKEITLGDTELTLINRPTAEK